MTTKSHNSIFLLTTLGVYLGILVAGAAPGVIAQQSGAMTRNFELSDEIEIKDDLDRKPDDADHRDHTDADTEQLLVSLASSIELAVSKILARSHHSNSDDTDPVLLTLPHSRAGLSTVKFKLAEFYPSDVRRSASFSFTTLPRASLVSAT